MSPDKTRRRMAADFRGCGHSLESPLLLSFLRQVP